MVTAVPDNFGLAFVKPLSSMGEKCWSGTDETCTELAWHNALLLEQGIVLPSSPQGFILFNVLNAAIK